VKETLSIASNSVLDLWVLKELVLQMPITTEHLLSLPGITAENFQSYGPKLLDITKRYYEIKFSLS